MKSRAVWRPQQACTERMTRGRVDGSQKAPDCSPSCSLHTVLPPKCPRLQVPLFPSPLRYRHSGPHHCLPAPPSFLTPRPPAPACPCCNQGVFPCLKSFSGSIPHLFCAWKTSSSNEIPPRSPSVYNPMKSSSETGRWSSSLPPPPRNGVAVGFLQDGPLSFLPASPFQAPYTSAVTAVCTY